MTMRSAVDADIGPEKLSELDGSLFVKRASMANDIHVDVSDVDQITLRVDNSGSLKLKESEES